MNHANSEFQEGIHSNTSIYSPTSDSVLIFGGDKKGNAAKLFPCSHRSGIYMMGAYFPGNMLGDRELPEVIVIVTG